MFPFFSHPIAPALAQIAQAASAAPARE
jgi:hypothetical protein